MELEKTVMIVSLADAATMSFQLHRHTDCHQFLQKGKQVYPSPTPVLGGLITIVVCCSCISFLNPWFLKNFFFVLYPVPIRAFGGLICIALL